MAVHTVFQKGTVGETFVRIDRWGVCEECISDSNSTNFYLTSVGGGITLISTIIGNTAAFKTLIAGTDITLVDSGTDITINSTASAGSGITSIVASGTGDETLIQSGAPPTAVLKMLTAGAGISLTSDGDQITIDNTASGNVYTAADDAAVTGVSIVSTPAPTAQDFRFNSILGGVGIGVALVGADVVVTNTGVAQVYTLSDAAGGTGISIIAPATGGGNDFHNYQLKAGAGMSVALIGSDILLTATGGGGGAGSLTSAGGTSIITDGAGPDFIIKGLAQSSSLKLTTTGTTFSFDNICIRIRDTAGGLPPTIDGATGTGSPCVAIGPSCSTTTSNSVSIGISNALTNRGCAVGRNNSLAGLDNVVFGVSNSAAAGFDANVILGISCTSTNDTGIVIGSSATNSGLRGISIGVSANCSGSDAVALGRIATASGASAVAFGWSATASGADSVAICHSAAASGTSSIAIGLASIASATNSISLGTKVRTTGANAASLGFSDDSTYILNNQADTVMVAKRAAGATTRYASFSTNGTFTRKPFWYALRDIHSFFSGGSTYTILASTCFGGTLTIETADAGKDVFFPTATSLHTLANPWGADFFQADMGGQFVVMNCANASNKVGIHPETTGWGQLVPDGAGHYTRITGSSDFPIGRHIFYWWFTSATTIDYFDMWIQ